MAQEIGTNIMSGVIRVGSISIAGRGSGNIILNGLKSMKNGNTKAISTDAITGTNAIGG